MQGDPRAVEDPIAAIFDLAEEVDAQTPKIRRALRYVRVFVWLWLAIDFLVIVAFSQARVLALLLLLVLLALLISTRALPGKAGRTALLGSAAVVSAVLALTFVAINLLVDLLYGVLDPRIRDE